jgi:hypothetical protein
MTNADRRQVREAFADAANEGLVGGSVDWQRIADHLNRRLQARTEGGKHRRPEPVE